MAWADVRSKAVVLLLLIFVDFTPPVVGVLIVICFVVRYLMSILIVQSS